MALPSRVEGKHYTYKDLLELPDDGKRYEIIDGELYVAPSPTTKHQRSTLRLSMSHGLTCAPAATRRSVHRSV